jgi:hypothetical protein
MGEDGGRRAAERNERGQDDPALDAVVVLGRIAACSGGRVGLGRHGSDISGPDAMRGGRLGYPGPTIDTAFLGTGHSRPGLRRKPPLGEIRWRAFERGAGDVSSGRRRVTCVE